MDERKHAHAGLNCFFYELNWIFFTLAGLDFFTLAGLGKMFNYMVKGFLVALSVQLPPHKFIQMGCQMSLPYSGTQQWAREYQILSVMVLIRFWLLVQGMKTKFKTKLKLKIWKNGMKRTKNDNDIKKKIKKKKKNTMSVLKRSISKK